MKRRSRVGDKRVKSLPKSATVKNRNAPNVTRKRGASIAGQETVVARLTRERDEALLRETANSEILRLISQSPGDLELVFRIILEHATRICNANFGMLLRFDGSGIRFVAGVGMPRKLTEHLKGRGSYLPLPGSHLERVMRTKRVSHTADYATEGVASPPVVLGGARSTVDVPMLKNKELIGVLSIYRQEVRPFTDKQIELVQNFAAQAVIAIENARLLNELRQRTTDLGEALDQQTASSDVLKIISSAPGELNAVFGAILSSATRICDATYGTLLLFENGMFRRIAHQNAPQRLAAEWRKNLVFSPMPDGALDRLVKTKRTVHVDAKKDSTVGLLAGLADARTLLQVPMLSEGELIGAIGIYRQEIRPFTDKQIALVENFAAQAVIAIENGRLLSELRESLEQQTATADVLRIISSRPGELESVFQAMLENATRICEAKFGFLFRAENGGFRIVASLHQYADKKTKHEALNFGPSTPIGRAKLTRQIVHVPDLAKDQAYLEREPLAVWSVEQAKVRTVLVVPMLKDEELIGVFGIEREEVRPFNDKQIGVVENFSAQAVIAIENARLLNELRQSLERQTATTDVLEVISRSRGDPHPVFQAILENATHICEAKFGELSLAEGDALRIVAMHNAPPAFVEFQKRRGPLFQPTQGALLDRAMRTKRVSHSADAAAEAVVGNPAKIAGARSTICVPMLKDDALMGAITIYRQEVRPFTDKQIELVQNFAAQAVLAIENARLLNDLNELNQQLEQRVTDQVGEIERMGKLRRFLPPQVADLIVASGTQKQLESHRREITALFCDLRGFTGFSESSDPEDVMALLRDYHAAIGQIIIKYSGTLERYAGDGVMVVFNDPVPVENPALQAVLMALEMRDAIGALTETWHRWGHDIGFGIGIAHGFATLGTIGFEGRFDYAAIGTVSNVASRLCDEAKPGQILISPRVLTKVENAVTVEPAGEFTLKGIRRPMTAYNIVAASPSKPN
jgi:GAF domain-containing protein